MTRKDDDESLPFFSDTDKHRIIALQLFFEWNSSSAINLFALEK
jgi:hypothetical protein